MYHLSGDHARLYQVSHQYRGLFWSLIKGPLLVPGEPSIQEPLLLSGKSSIQQPVLVPGAPSIQEPVLVPGEPFILTPHPELTTQI